MPDDWKKNGFLITPATLDRLYPAIRRKFKTTFSIDQLTARMKDEVERALLGSEALSVPTIVNPKKTRKEKIRDKAIEARDKWIYEQCCKGVAYDAIALRLKKKSVNWPRIESKQGIQSAAQRYAKRHNLSDIPRRKDDK
jgi:hypothetical protein